MFKKKTSFPKIKMSILNLKKYKGMIASFRAKYLNKPGENWRHVLFGLVGRVQFFGLKFQRASVSGLKMIY